MRTKTTELSEDQRDYFRKDVHDAFKLFDSNRDGLLDIYEAKIALKALGVVIGNNSELVALMEGGMDLKKFEETAFKMMDTRNSDEDIERAFKLFDDDSSGYITLKKLKRVSREIGQAVSQEELSAMIEQFDQNGDGQIDVDEFKAIMRYAKY